MYENAKRELIGTCIEMERCELVRLSGGNASVRVAHDRFVVTPSGMRYGSLDTDDIVVVDGGGAVIEGRRRPSVDTEALLYIYRSLPQVNAILHTHQTRATAIGVVMDRMPAVFTPLVNAVLGDVRVAPYASASSIAMGKVAVEYLRDRRAVILKHHGVLTVGTTLSEALYAAVYLEDAAAAYVTARALGDPPELTDEQTAEAVAVFRNYGQKPATG